MFDAFHGHANGGAATRKRFLGPVAIAIAAYALIGGSVALLASGGSEKPPEDEPIDVVLAKKPQPSTAPPPSPVVKPPDPALPTRPRSSAPPPPALQAPKVMPTQAPPEDDASKNKDPGPVDPGAEYGDGASDGSDEPGTGNVTPTPSPTPSPTPVAPPKPKKMEPVDLPENATPPVPDPDNAAPSYPEAARAAGQEGLVILKLAISEKGKIRSIEVLKSDPAFDDAAIDAVKRWKFTPAMVSGSPIAVYRIVKIPFRLGG